MPDKEPINDAQADEADSTGSRLTVASAEFRSAADDLVSAQRQAIAEQKNTDRPARYTSQTFGRVEIADDAGASLVKGYDSKGGDRPLLADVPEAGVGDTGRTEKDLEFVELRFLAQYLGYYEGKELYDLLHKETRTDEELKRRDELVGKFEDVKDLRWQELRDTDGSELSEFEKDELASLSGTHKEVMTMAKKVVEVREKLARGAHVTPDERSDYENWSKRPAVVRRVQEILDRENEVEE